MRYMKRNARAVLSIWATCLLAACGGSLAGPGQDADNPNPDDTPTESLSSAAASEHFNDAVVAALESGAAVQIDTDAYVELDGEVTLSDATVTFTQLHIVKAPLSFDGHATVEAEGDIADIEFDADVTGTVEIGSTTDAIEGLFPVTADFALSSALFLIGPYMTAGVPATPPGAGCPNLTVTDNGDGTFTLDGDCSCGNLVVDFDMVTVDPGPPLSIDGSITIDDGNGNVIELEFNGNTATVFVNGQEVGQVTIS